jgi:hypothetical protein
MPSTNAPFQRAGQNDTAAMVPSGTIGAMTESGRAATARVRTTVLADIRRWPVRRHVTAAGVAAATVLVIGVPTVLIPNPVFSREVPPTWWAWPALIATALLTGLIVSTYVRSPLQVEHRDRPGKLGALGGILSFFAVGCPVCNKLVLLALGTSGALQVFQPIQPLLALASIGLLAWALTQRIKRESTCSATGTVAAAPAG